MNKSAAATLPKVNRVAIIGAGPSGLSTLKTLLGEGLDAVCFESGARVGGQWAMDNPGGHSGAYSTLRTNTNRAMSRFSDFEFPAHYPEYPGHTLMADWFDLYVHHFELSPHIRLSTPVSLIRGDDLSGYSLYTADSTTPQSFDAVVAATGNLWDPVIPDFIHAFEGPWVHSHAYREPCRPLPMTGKRVLVVGLGNSGCEIAVELSACADVLLAARSGQNILPRIAPGDRTPPHPADLDSRPFPDFPRWLRDTAFRAVFPIIMRQLKKRLPDPQAFGLPASPADPFSKRAVVNDQIFETLRTGRIGIRPGIEGIQGTTVHFVDGRREQVETIVLATGYRFSLPYIDPLLLATSDLADLRLYQGIMHPVHTRLFVVGVMRALCSIWPYSEQQARWIAARLTDRFDLPSRKRRESHAWAILRGPLLNCQFKAADLRKEARLV